MTMGAAFSHVSILLESCVRWLNPEPGRTIGLAWRKTSPRKADFIALGEIAVEALAAPGRQ